MPTNFEQFVIQVDREGPEQLGEDFSKFIRLMGLDLLRGIILSSPVGDPTFWKGSAPKGYVGGSFRGAWVVTLDSPSERILDRPDPGGQRVEAEGSRVIAQWRPYQSIWLSNNMPYARRLEDGWSTRQAPQGVVRVNVARVQSRFRRVEA